MKGSDNMYTYIGELMFLWTFLFYILKKMPVALFYLDFS